MSSNSQESGFVYFAQESLLHVLVVQAGADERSVRPAEVECGWVVRNCAAAAAAAAAAAYFSSSSMMTL